MGKLVFDFSPKRAISQMLCFLAPIVIELFRIPFFDPKLTNFLRKIFWETFNERKRINYKRNDLIDLTIEMKENSKADEQFEFVSDRLAAQAGQFFVAGFEGNSSIMAFALYELCLQPDIQSKARQEIKCAISKHGNITYEALKDMKYLEIISLRKYPTLPFLDRLCIKDYKLPNSEFVIEKGTPVYIPIFGLHYDPKYFPNPEKFDPEKFSDENRNFTEYAFIPFGKGPRSCIPARFAFLSSKLGLAHILSEFEIVKTAKTPVPIEYETRGLLLSSKVGLPMRFKNL